MFVAIMENRSPGADAPTQPEHEIGLPAADEMQTETTTEQPVATHAASLAVVPIEVAVPPPVEVSVAPAQEDVEMSGVTGDTPITTSMAATAPDLGVEGEATETTSTTAVPEPATVAEPAPPSPVNVDVDVDTAPASAPPTAAEASPPTDFDHVPSAPVGVDVDLGVGAASVPPDPVGMPPPIDDAAPLFGDNIGLGVNSMQEEDPEISGDTDTADAITPTEVEMDSASEASEAPVTTIATTVSGAELIPEVSDSARRAAPAMVPSTESPAAPDVVVEQIVGDRLGGVERSRPRAASGEVADESVVEPVLPAPSAPEIASELDATPCPTGSVIPPLITPNSLEAAVPTEIDQVQTRPPTCGFGNEPEPETLASTSITAPPLAGTSSPEPTNKTNASTDGPSRVDISKPDAPSAPTPGVTFPLAKVNSPEIGALGQVPSQTAGTKVMREISAAPVRNALLASANVPEFPNQPDTPPMRSVTPPFNTSNMPEFATPTQPTNRDLRNIILAAASSVQAQFHHQGSVPPSPVVEPGALHELDNFSTPGRRRSSAVGGIAGLEELRNREAVESDRFDQLIQATKFGGEDESTPLVDAFLRLDFEDGNVYYIRNPSVVFGRAEGSAAGYYSHIGPDGSTIIETGPRGFGRTTSSGLTSMKREKKKRKKKKDEVGVAGSAQSIASDSAPSRRGSEFAQPPRFRNPFGFGDMGEAEEPVIHLPLSNASIGDGVPLPRKNISRRHARLFYNAQNRRFELEIMGKNGAFVDEEYVQAGTTIVVEEKGMKVQIGGISFNVIVPEIPIQRESAKGDEDEELVATSPRPNFTGGKGKIDYNFRDDSGDEVNYSDEDLEMEDVAAEPDSGGDGSIGNDSGQESDGDGPEDGGGSGGDADEEGDQDESSDEAELEDSPSPKPIKPIRPRPMKSTVDIRKKEQELQRDRDRIKELQRQLKEKEREKAEAEAEALRMEHEEQRELEQKREKEQQREISREKERERVREEKRKKKAAEKATETQRLKEQKQKDREIRAAKEREKERERERKKQQKLQLPQPPTPRRESKLILPTISSGKTTPVRQSPAPSHPEPRPPPSLLLHPSAAPLDQSQPPQQPLSPLLPPPPTPPTSQLLQPQQSQQSPAQHYQEQAMSYTHDYDVRQHQEMQYQQSLAQQLVNQHQMYSAASAIDPALYASHNQPMPSMAHDPQILTAYHQPVTESKPRKEKATPRSKKMRTPSPEINEADLPPELLIKPNVSYVVMIHEAILNSVDKVLSLPQIYKAIETKYPYYKFKVQTQGWQSSVRHNLGQHKAFYKVDRAGKGWLWGVVDGVSIEKEKKGNAAKQAMPGYDGMQSPNGQCAHLQNGQMVGHMGGPPTTFHQQSNYQVANGTQQPMTQMPLPPMPPQQMPLPPSYMPAKQPAQPFDPSTQPNSRAFEAPIPRPTGGTQPLDQKDVKQVIAVLNKIIASTNPNNKKKLDQLKNFLAQLASGKSSAAALSTVSSLVGALNRPDAPTTLKTASTESPPPAVPRTAPVPAASMRQGSPPPPLSVSTPVSASSTPAKGPVKLTPGVTFANLGQHIKNMSAEERAEWTRKLLELKQQKAAAAAAKAQSSATNTIPPAPAPVTPRPTVAGKAPIPIEKFPSLAGTAPSPSHPTTAGKDSAGPGAGKHPVGTGVGSVPPESPQMSPNAIQKYLAKAKASQALKRPLDSSSNSPADSGEPLAKKVDVGAKE